MDSIGGYFGLELSQGKAYHENALCLNTGRNCLEYILLSRGYKKLFLPFYVCSVVLEPLRKLGVEYEFYRIDSHLEMEGVIPLKDGEALLYVNYFGLKQRYVESLAIRYGRKLIIDNTQAFYANPVDGIDSFYSCRKFFGVPDGAYLYTDKYLDLELEQDVSCDRMTHLVKRIEFGAEAGYSDFRSADAGLSGQPIRKMSHMTHRLMQGIDYEQAARRRRANYQLLDTLLGSSNEIQLDFEVDAVPMVYPYLVPVKGLRERLIAKRVFVACYWPDVQDWTEDGNVEYILASQMLPLPIDQRYGEEEMMGMVKDLNELKCLN